LELAGEPLGVKAEGGESAMGVDNVEADGGLLGGRVGGAIEEGSFKRGDAVEAPGCVGEFLGELSFGGGGGFVLVEELAAVEPVGSWWLVASGWLLARDWRGKRVCHTKKPPVWLWHGWMSILSAG
jgi:hypothetical protein